MRIILIRLVNWYQLRKHGLPTVAMVRHIMRTKGVRKSLRPYAVFYMQFEDIDSVARILGKTRERCRQILYKAFVEWRQAQ